MSEKLPIPRLQVTARPAKKSKIRKTEAEKAETRKNLDKARAKTKVNIGTAFQKWRHLKEVKGFKSDAVVAHFLLESFMNSSTSTTVKPGFMRPPPPSVSTDASESSSDQKCSYGQSWIVCPMLYIHSNGQ